MRVPFRQGIVYAPPNFVSLAANNSVNISLALGETVAINFADGMSANYLVSESKTVYGAWAGPFLRGKNYWLYWDIDVITAEKTYGYTTLDPVAGPTAPASPNHGQHWFDTTKYVMFEYNAVSARWQRKIRVFACKLFDGVQFVSVSINSPAFIGTQIGDASDIVAGSLVYDNSGSVLKKGDGTFFTTEDVVTTGLGSSALVKLENAVLTAQAAAPIPRYSVVRFVDFNKVVPATNMLTDPGIYGVVEQAAGVGDVVSVIIEGVLYTPDWDLQIDAQINDLVYVNATGELTLIPQPTQIVGVVSGPNSVLLTNMLVDAIGYIDAAVTITSPSHGVIITGVDGPKSASFNVTLEGDLLALENLTDIGVAHRDGDGIWSAGLIDLQQTVENILPVANGGTGADTLVGYVKANGITPFTSTLLIPGGDVDGDITGNADNVTGIVAIAHGGTGANTTEDAINNLLPAQAAGMMLTSNGNTVEWKIINPGTVVSVDAVTTSAGLSVTGGPITSSGAFNIELTGSLRSLGGLTSTGFLARDGAGNILTQIINSPNHTIEIGNVDGGVSGGVQLSLPVLTAPANYARVSVDEFGRTIGGDTTLDWYHITPNTIPTSIGGYGIVDAYTKTETAALTWNWTSITGAPTTVAGYGITNAYTKQETEALSWDWSKIVATPTTLAGYGITDSVKNAGGTTSVAVGASINKPAAGTAGRVYIDTTLRTLSVDNGATWANIGNTGTVTSVGVTSASTNLVVTSSPVTTAGTINLSLAGNLSAVSTLSSTGLVARRSNGNWVTRAVLGSLGSISVANSDADAGDIVLDLADAGTPGTYYGVTTDIKGRVISGTSSLAVPWANISNKPTTIAGYGITNAVDSSLLGVASGVATLDNLGKIPASQMPAIAITNTSVVASQSEMLALSAQVGDVAVRTDIMKTFILTDNNPSFLTSWQELVNGGSSGGVSYVDCLSDNTNIVITGGPVIDTGAFHIALTGNLGSASAINTSGVVKVASGSWTAGKLDLVTDVTNTLPVMFGGTGASNLVGYVKGNATSPFTSSATIPGADVDGDITGKSSNVTGTVAVINGGTGASSASQAIINLTPALPQSGGYLRTDGTSVTWATTLDGTTVAGIVPHAYDADALGGHAANEYPLVNGAGAMGTWGVDISGSAASLGGSLASLYPLADGTRANGTWNINIAGSAASLGGKAASEYALVDGSNTTGTWSINTTGSAGSVSGVVTIIHGGTGATSTAGAVNNLLGLGGNAGRFLTTDGSMVSWVEVNDSVAAYKLFNSGSVALAARNTASFDTVGFVLTDDETNLWTNITLHQNLNEVANGSWIGATSITTVGTITSGTWNGTTLAVANGGTGATDQPTAANNILPTQTNNSGKVLSTNGTNVSWATPTATFANVTAKPTTLSGYGITDAVASSHLTDYVLHLTASQNTWLDAVTVSSAEVNYLTGVTSAIQTQLGAKEATANKGANNGYAGLDATGKVPYAQVKGPVASTQVVAATAFYEYDSWADFGANYDAKTLLISVKVLDGDNTSPTYNMYINSEAVATVAVKDSRYIRVYNDFTASLTFHVSVRP